MAFRRLQHGEAGLGQQLFRLLAHLLPVLQRAGGMIGDAAARGLIRVGCRPISLMNSVMSRASAETARGLFRQAGSSRNMKP